MRSIAVHVVRVAVHAPQEFAKHRLVCSLTLPDGTAVGGLLQGAGYGTDQIDPAVPFQLTHR